MSDQDFNTWANSIENLGGPEVKPIPVADDNGGIAKGATQTELQSLLSKAMSTPDSTQYAYKTADLSSRFNATFKGIDNEELYAKNQKWTDKMMNGVGKGLLLTGTTFLQSTAGLVNGLGQWAKDGKFSSFYDNDYNKSLDEFNKKYEDILPNYYTQEEKNADWYSPSKILTANFLWDGIVKNMGFSAGAALSGMVYAGALASATKALSSMGGAAKLLSIGKTGETVAAIEEGLLATDKAAGTFGKIKSLSDQYLGSYKVLSTGQRAVVAGLSTTGEAGFEAYNNLNQFRSERIAEYKKTHLGLAPEGADLEEINRQADSVGNSSFGLNTALLTATNYIQFPKILGSSYRAEKGIVNSLTKEIEDVAVDATGKFIEAPTKFGKVLSTINKVRPYLFSASEGFEEGAQYAIQVGTQDYYNKKYKNDTTRSFLDSLGEGIGQTLTTNEGMSNILIGGLSGSLMQVRGKFSENAELSKNTAAALGSSTGANAGFNTAKLSDFTKATIDSVNRGTAIQEDREAAIRQGDVLESKDKEADYIINYLTPRIKYGRFDLVTSDIADYRQLAMTDEGFSQLQAEGKAYASDTREQFLQRLNSLETTANNIKSLHQSLSLRYGGMVNEDKKPLYNQEVMDKMIYAASKVADYDKRIPQLSEKLLNSGVDNIDSIINDLIAGDSASYNEAKAIIENGNPITKDDSLQALQDISEISLRRQQFLKEYNDIKTKPAEYTTQEEEEEPIPDVVNKGKKTISIKDANGDRELEIGTEYYAGGKRDTNEGYTISKFSRFTVVGETENGDIIIQGADGKQSKVTKEAFEKYKLGKVSDTDKRENAKFFIDTTDHIFKFNLGKGVIKEGTLSYDPDTDRLFFYSLDGKFVRQVTRDQFSPKQGFTVAQIWSNKKFTMKASEALQAEVSAQEKLDTRNKIILDLYTSSKERLDEINKTLDKNKEKLSDIVDALDNLSKTKEGLARKQFTKAIKKTINDLSTAKQDVENQIASLEAEKEELEATLPYFQDLSQNTSELAEGGVELLAQLKDDISTLEELIDNTGDAIKTGKSLVKSIDEALTNALSLLNDFVKRLKEENKNVPLSLEALQTNLEKYQGEEGAKAFIEGKLGYTELVLDLESQINDFSNELKIPDLSNRVEKLREQIKELESGINELINEQIAKQQILAAFEKFVEEKKIRDAEIEKQKKDQALVNEMLGTLNDSMQNTEYDSAYDPNSRKSNTEVVTGTTPATKEYNNGPLAAHHVRANLFGFRLNNEKKNVRGVIVTSANESQLGLPGLTQHLKDAGDPIKAANVNTEETIVLVMVNNDGKLVGVDGEVLESPTVHNAIYQVFPKTLTWGNNNEDSMFRDPNSHEAKELTKKYNEWRADTLSNPSLTTYEIKASFGNPEYSTKQNDEGKEVRDYEVTSVQAAGLITDDALINAPALVIPTTNPLLEKGTTRFENALGRVFLSLKNGYTKLKNRQLTKEEAPVIYAAMHQLASNMNNIKSPESVRLINWLRTIVYWGTPQKNVNGEFVRKNAGYNSVWFEKVDDGLMLFMSGKGEAVCEFTPASLEENKDKILTLLGGMYNNINSKRVQTDWNRPYEEIIGISADGKIETRDWDNYQSYLLSSKTPDGKTRKSYELPLSTPMRAVKNEDDANRVGIYFTYSGNEEKFIVPKVTIAPTSVVLTPAAAKQTAAAKAVTPNATPGKFVLDGITENIITLSAGQIKFKLDGNQEVVPGESLTLTNLTIDPAVSSAFIEKQKLVDNVDANGIIIQTVAQQVQNIYGAYVLQQVAPEIEAMKVAKEAAIAAQAAPVVSDIDAKKADIEKRRQEAESKITPIEIDVTDKTGNKTGEVRIKEYATIYGGERLAAKTEEGLKKLIEIKYDAELAALEGGVVETTPESTILNDDASIDDDLQTKINAAVAASRNDSDFRLRIEQQAKKFAGEDWKKLEQWLKTYFPNVPVYRVQNIIQATNGRQAWGMLHDGAIYIYENAEVGTAYHEVFEAVWKMFSDPQERAAIQKEFRNRKGTFVDRVTGKEYNYKDATDQDLKEQLAEEFRNYVLTGKVPVKPVDGRPYIVKLFSDLVNFIKNFFTGKNAKNNTEKLFEKIGNGYYKDYSPYHSKLAFAKKGVIDIQDAYGDNSSEFSIAGITGEQLHDIMQQMTYATVKDLFSTNEGLFNIIKQNKKALYAKLKADLENTILNNIGVSQQLKNQNVITPQQYDGVVVKWKGLYNTTLAQWEAIKAKHEEYLNTFNISFDENDEAILRDENNSGKESYQEANKIDGFKKANSAIKLLLSSLPIIGSNGKEEVSSIGGYSLLSTSQTFMAVMNNVHASNNIDEMIEGIRKMANEDKSYKKLYYRLTLTDSGTDTFDFTNLENTHELSLLTALWQTFKKQNPDVKNVFILENGDVQVGDASLTSAARQVKSDYIGKIIETFKKENRYYAYDEKQKAYIQKKDAMKGLQSPDLDKRIEFLKSLNIIFNKKEIQDLKDDKLKLFNDATDGIIKSIYDVIKVNTITPQTLHIDGRLLSLGLIRAAISTPEFSSTYFNVNGERTQSFIGTNPASDLYDILSKIDNKSELANTRYAYLLTDSFSKHSVLLDKIFNTNTGERRSGTRELMKTAYADGIIDTEKGKQKQSSKLTYKDRLIQEINLNIEGYYLNLVPGDASMEWMIKMGNAINSEDLVKDGIGWRKTIPSIFKGYFIDELNLVREKRPTRDSNEFRFFKSILGEELQKSILKEKKSLTAEQIYDKYENKINAAVKSFIEDEADNFKRVLSEYGIIKSEVDGWNVSNLKIGERENIENDVLTQHLSALNVNFIINNIELHKLLYSDPYQYSDELKRIKNFNSPRQAIINGSPKMNAALNAVWNKGFKKGDIGYTDFTKDYLVSATHNDVFAHHDLPGYKEDPTNKKWKPYEDTDGSGIANYKAYRNFRIRAGNWNDNEEKQFRYDMAWEKRDKNLSLSNQELVILDNGNPEVKSAYTPIKPIVAGNKGDGKSYNDVLLDKFAIYPLSYRIMKELNPEANIIALYEKMDRENVDYIVFKSARKVGAPKELHETYNEDGSFNDAPYKSLTNVPFGIMSVQSEVPSKDAAQVTRGSQITKLATLDFMEAGVPIDYNPKGTYADRYKSWYSLTEDQKLAYNKGNNLYKEIKNNQKLLEEMTEVGYQSLLKRMGIIETFDKDGESVFTITDFTKAKDTIREEVLKREVNDNISAALNGFLNGTVVLEATPAYQQIKNILYSIADKEVVSPKISGGLKVQLPSALLESVKAKSELINGKQAYTSDTLKFYKNKDGERVCEIMIGRWFKSDKTDEELLNEWYKEDADGNKVLTEEGRKILSGIGFRTPTQKQNSIDSFVIAKFLPKEFGDSIIVPSALVKKAGSDFDIDKLSIYLKNLFKDENGKLGMVESKGSESATKEFYGKVFDKILEKDKTAKESALLQAIKDIDVLDAILLSDEDSALENILLSKNKKLDTLIMHFGDIIDDVADFLVEKSESLRTDIEKLNNATIQKELREFYVDRKYKQSLENEYIQSLQNLVSHELNFDNLVKPNSSEQLHDLADKITKARGIQSLDSSDVGNMLNRHYMSRLRHAFISGKYAIGIAAVNQTNHSLNQRERIYLDFSKLNRVSKDDAYWLEKNGLGVNFVDKNGKPAYNMIDVDGEMVPTLSMAKNTAGQYISDIISQFIDGYVDISKGPWIMELGATPNVASTFLFLVKLGVPIDTVSYFMNQPIIRDYLRSIENAGYSWLFINDFVKDIKADPKYKTTDSQLSKIDSIPKTSSLFENIGKIAFSEEEKAGQQYMLDEFLKYAKMANQLFLVTQGSNYDTATFNDGYLIFKKNEQLKKARNTIISSVDSLLNNSYIGKLRSTMVKMRNALAEVLISDKPNVRRVIENVLENYINEPDRDFIKIAQTAVNNLFDWAVQIDTGLNKYIESILLNNVTSAAQQIANFVGTVEATPGHALRNNEVIKLIKTNISSSSNGVNTISIKNKDNKVYDQNKLIYAFEELKTYLKDYGDKDLYKQLVALSVLQSGLTSSPISFTSLLPYEDFKNVYNDVLSKLEQRGGLDVFNTLNVFERNNWNNNDIVPRIKAKYKFNYATGRSEQIIKNLRFAYGDNVVKKAILDGKIPDVVKLDSRSMGTDSDVIIYSWEKGTPAEKKAARRIGDYSYIQKGLFKKVYNGVEPLVNYDKYGNPQFVFKMINAWGDSYKANEFYDVARPSKIDNGFLKVEQSYSEIETPNGKEIIKTSAEVDDDVIVPYFTLEKGVSLQDMNLAPEELLEDYSQTTGLTIGIPAQADSKLNFKKGPCK